jgi:polysaccharide export outer membrane protein
MYLFRSVFLASVQGISLPEDSLDRGFTPVPDNPAVQNDSSRESGARTRGDASFQKSSISQREIWAVLVRRRRFIGLALGGLLVLCFIYCLVVPNQYEASAKIAVRTSPASSLSLEAAEPSLATSVLSAQVQQETLANVLRTDQLAWRVICELKLYQAPGFMGRFNSRFPGFKPEAPSAAAEAYLLERFQRRLHVQTVPRTLLLDVRFRSKDSALSAAVVNGLIRAYVEQESESRLQATSQASSWLENQLKDLKMRVDRDQLRLAAFQSDNGILSTPETLANGQPSEVQHLTVLLEIDELGRQLVAATTDRILREAEFRAASHGDPERVMASDPRLQAEGSNFPTALLTQIHGHHSELELEQAQLGMEHGPNFPRVVEIRSQLQNLDRQLAAEDAKLVERFRSAWVTAQDREQLVRNSLEQQTSEGMKQNRAATQYAVMRQEANSSHELYLRVVEKVEEAGLAAGIHGSNISVVDYARPPAKPVAPDLPLYMTITFFVGLWLAAGGAFLLESLKAPAGRTAAILVAILLAGFVSQAQAPTPSTSGLPTGVARIPLTHEVKTVPNAKDAPAVWNDAVGTGQPVQAARSVSLSESPMPAPIGPGDFLEINEFHTPEFHSSVRVSADGTVMLPMVKDVHVGGLDEQGAAHAIEAALLGQGMLLHPQVSVLVTAYMGQDVSVLGEVARPGVYPYTLHHRMLDLISAASGLAPSAGRLVNVFHRSDPKTPHPVVLDPGGTDIGSDHNPELTPGDTVQVSRAGLVFVIGDVVRPGGFPVDPAQGLTVVQALSLAWGPTQNAATSKALLIREQKSGRTLTTLNVKRLLHGQDPDQPIYDRDILFIPDSAAKNLMNRTMEAAIQSAVGVTIYAGLVYSQRF